MLYEDSANLEQTIFCSEFLPYIIRISRPFKVKTKVRAFFHLLLLLRKVLNIITRVDVVRGDGDALKRKIGVILKMVSNCLLPNQPQELQYIRVKMSSIIKFIR